MAIFSSKPAAPAASDLRRERRALLLLREDRLRENLYALGRKLTPKETLERVVGGPLDPEPYLGYLRAKHAGA